jgi:DNA modification methylase
VNAHNLIIGDSTFMPEIKSESIHLVVTSPPYWNLKRMVNKGQDGKCLTNGLTASALFLAIAVTSATILSVSTVQFKSYKARTDILSYKA